MPKVSVIIAVYNVAPYVEKCARSLFGQTLDDMEFIFVDDCSPDNSIEIINNILEDYPSRKGQVRFLYNTENLGQAGARKKAMSIATGDYIIHCDSDDWVELDMYKTLYDRGVLTNADIVTCDYFDERPNETTIVGKEIFKDSHANLLDINTKPHFTLTWNLIKREIITSNELFPIQGLNMWEDFLVVIKAYYYANKIEHVEKPLYHYNKLNENATTSHPFSDKYLEQEKQCVSNLETFFSDKDDLDFTNLSLILKKMIRDRYLYQTPPNYKKWRECYPEAADVNLAFENPNWIYRAAYEIAKRGIFFPLKSYRFLSHLIRSNKN